MSTAPSVVAPTVSHRAAVAQTLTRATITGDVEQAHAAIAALQPSWSWSKCRRYARRLINSERFTRAAIYARIPAAPNDRGPFGRRDHGAADQRNTTALRAAHNIDFPI